MRYDIVIIGAGASGLAAAYRAIHNHPELKVLVIEKEKIAGRKLNASGNGKCNLTNSDFSVECYYSENRDFLEQWIDNSSYKDIISFFEELGVLLYEKNGYYYPISNQAKQVSHILYEKSSMLGVKYMFQTTVISVCSLVKNNESFYQVKARQNNETENCYEAKYVMIATGGYASMKLGGCKCGYQIAKQLKLKCNPIYPVLSPVYVEDSLLSLAKGVRLDGRVTLQLPDGRVIKESGQIQFNDNNLSGIVMMNLSCYLNVNSEYANLSVLHIDVMPDYSWADLRDFFDLQIEKFPDEALDIMLNGLLPGNFVRYLLKRLGLDGRTQLSSLTEKQMNRLTSTLKKLVYPPVFVEEFEKAQVTGGGISVEEVHSQSFECKSYKNMYITGEVLDVNGKCGGYNLTFAILSGIKAVDNIISHY